MAPVSRSKLLSSVAAAFVLLSIPTGSAPTDSASEDSATVNSATFIRVALCSVCSLSVINTGLCSSEHCALALWFVFLVGGGGRDCGGPVGRGGAGEEAGLAGFGLEMGLGDRKSVV